MTDYEYSNTGTFDTRFTDLDGDYVRYDYKQNKWIKVAPTLSSYLYNSGELPMSPKMEIDLMKARADIALKQYNRDIRKLMDDLVKAVCEMDIDWNEVND